MLIFSQFNCLSQKERLKIAERRVGNEKNKNIRKGRNDENQNNVNFDVNNTRRDQIDDGMFTSGIPGT